MSDEISTKQVREMVPILQKLARSKGAVRQLLEESGVHVLPCNFYSGIPSTLEIENSFEYAGTEAPFSNPEVFSREDMRKALVNLIPFAAEFDPPRSGDEENCSEYFWENSQFGYSDALSYYALIRQLKPAQIVEIGSGFSSLVAKKALEDNGTGRLDCIEPYPRHFLKSLSGLTLHEKPVQSISSTSLNKMLRDGDILFIDSTHTVKNGSDCVHLYLRLLPEIKRDIYVHVHDVFLPYAFPKHWHTDHHLFWTESYLLYAFLLDNPKTSVVFASNFNAHEFPTEMERFMGGKAAPGGASIWFRYEGRR
jgi:hypothetical protein